MNIVLKRYVLWFSEWPFGRGIAQGEYRKQEANRNVDGDGWELQCFKKPIVGIHEQEPREGA